MMLSSICGILLSAITLDGVTGGTLVARTSFDANNVRVGDPMVLRIDFIGQADFTSLHPPALSKVVDSKVWKVDDESAKTDTGEFSRTLIYRVRPMKEGVWRFPRLEFEYGDGGEGVLKCATREIPVHVKPGMQAALAGLDESQEGLPMPDALVYDVKSVVLSEDEAFRWRKACGKAQAGAFSEFSFPEARLNEAACHIMEGNWAKALKIYSRLEWSIGQTKSVERGIVAALARKTGDGAQELPAWRAAFRPVLRHAWKGRIAVTAGAIAAVSLLFFLAGRLIRMFAVVALVVSLPLSSPAQSIFDEIERMHQQMMQRANSMMNLGSPGAMSMTINGQQQEPVEIKAAVSLSTNDVRVGETFRFLVSIESPRSVTIDQIRIPPSEMFGMVVMGGGENLEDGESANPSNRVRRLAVPVRYDVPFKGEMSFRVEGMVNRRQQSGRSMFSFSQSFAVDSPAISVEIKPLPGDGRPEGFAGIIGSGFKLARFADRTRVETNDVVRLKCVLEYESGFVPLAAIPDMEERRPGRIVWREYFVADGAKEIPEMKLPVYDTAARSYSHVAARKINIEYAAASGREAEAVAVNEGGSVPGRILELRFAPKEEAPVIERFHLAPGEAEPEAVSRHGAWVRIATPSHEGWVKAHDLEKGTK